MLAEKKYKKTAQLMFSELGEEGVVQSLENGNLHMFNTTATRIWKLLDEYDTALDISESLSHLYHEISKEELIVDTHEIMGQFEAAGLIAVSSVA